MMKISKSRPRPSVAAFRLEGRLVDAWVGEVRKCYEAASGIGHSVVLDMSNVSFADADGVELLRTLHAQGVCLVHCSAFLAAQIGLEEKESRSC